MESCHILPGTRCGEHDPLIIRWPSGKLQTLANLTGNRHIIVDEDKEGADAVTTVTPGQPIP